MAKKPYSPLASYNDLKRVEQLLNQAQTIDDIRKLVVRDGPKVGYKAFCYMLGGKMTPEAMKADEACVAAATLEQQGKTDEAMAIYKRVIEVHPDHPVAKGKVEA
jgi:tetratricopeptide (TPR) repeat protein